MAPVDDALDRLQKYIKTNGLYFELNPEDALATVREALERQRGRIYILENMRSENYIEELESAEVEADKYRKATDQQARRAEAAEAEARQLREERDAWKQRHIDSERDWRKEWLAREAAEAEVQRLTELNARERKARKAVEELNADAVVAARTNLEAQLESERAEVRRLREGIEELASDVDVIWVYVRLRALLSASPDGDCEHEWVSARNEAVLSGLICVKCHALAAGPDGGGAK